VVVVVVVFLLVSFVLLVTVISAVLRTSERLSRTMDRLAGVTPVNALNPGPLRFARFGNAKE
jgi:threonine/homoserine/homoserine lactone efflux protein